MGRYLKLSAITSMFFYFIIYSFVNIYLRNYKIEDGIVQKSQEFFFNKGWIIFFILMVITVFLMFFFNRVKEKNSSSALFLLIYLIPFSILSNLVTAVYLIILIANIPYLNLKDEYMLKKPVINEKSVKNAEEISKKSAKIKYALKNAKKIEKNGTNLENYNSIEKIDEIYDFIEKNAISQNMSDASYLKQSVYADIYYIQKYELEYIRESLTEGNKEEGIKRYLRMWEINQKLLQTREKSYFIEVLTENSISRLVDFYFENYQRIGIAEMKRVDFEKIKSDLKLSFKDSVAFDFYDHNRIISEIKIPLLLKPFINNILMKKIVEERYLTVLNKYELKNIKNEVRYENIFERNKLAAPITGMIYNISKGSMENYMLKNMSARTKIDIIQYVIKSNGNLVADQMPVSLSTGKRIKLGKIESNGKVSYIIKLEDDFYGNGKESLEYKF